MYTLIQFTLTCNLKNVDNLKRWEFLPHSLLVDQMGGSNLVGYLNDVVCL